MLYVGIQEGMIRMSKKRYYKDLGSTASCVMPSVDAGNKFTAFLTQTVFDLRFMAMNRDHRILLPTTIALSIATNC